MTERERILGLSGWELDAEVAEKVMGWKRWIHANGVAVFWNDPKGTQRALRSYSSDYNAVRTMEDEIERRGLQAGYIEALASVTLDTPRQRQWEELLPCSAFAGRLLRASAADRCRAALLACQE